MKLTFKLKELNRLKGGPGSGHHGHSGRPGKVGGSTSGGGGGFRSLGAESANATISKLDQLKPVGWKKRTGDFAGWSDISFTPKSPTKTYAAGWNSNDLRDKITSLLVADGWEKRSDPVKSPGTQWSIIFKKDDTVAYLKNTWGTIDFSIPQQYRPDRE